MEICQVHDGWHKFFKILESWNFITGNKYRHLFSWKWQDSFVHFPENACQTVQSKEPQFVYQSFFQVQMLLHEQKGPFNSQVQFLEGSVGVL